MLFLKENIEKKLRNSILNENLSIPKYGFSENNLFLKKIVIFENRFLNSVKEIKKKILFNFIFFISKVLVNKKRKRSNFLLFLNFYEYINTFFFNNKILFYKKYFLKHNFNSFYLEKFVLNRRIINYTNSLLRLRTKKKEFYKKNIWTKNRRFRKKNLLIFNKKFFKVYTSNRFNSFIVDSLLPFFKLKKAISFRFVKKAMFNILHKKYYYLFLHKKHIFSIPRKKNKRALFTTVFFYRTYSKCYVKRKFYKKWRRKFWRQAYHSRRRRRFFRLLLLQFHFNAFDKMVLSYKKKIKKRRRRKIKFKLKKYNKLVLFTYLKNYCNFLSLRYYKDKSFRSRFSNRRIKFKRFKNIFYFVKFKKKFFFYKTFNVLQKKKSIKKIILSLILFKFFFRKIVWRKRKYLKSFYVFYYTRFLFNKVFSLFNSNLKANFFFYNYKRIRAALNYKKRRFTYYNKKLRKRLTKKSLKGFIIKFFLLLALLKITKKHKNIERIFVLRNAFFLKNFKRLNLGLTFSLFSKNNFYFITKPLICKDNYVKNDLKLLSLLNSI